ncbi:hypothetical protein F6B42_13165 [Microbacterium radiodurans]|uniref:Type II secretion system protein n=1 Tax=Microbacterium radiodurans TaxID=661398 RepID=A0A5J5IRX4_9MICO|nr:hypothetical protein F6B42_13165 [Microbacterium radiodurans]
MMLLVTAATFVVLSVVSTAANGWSSEVTTANEKIAGDFADNDLLQRTSAVAATAEAYPIAAIRYELALPAGTSVPPGITWEILGQTSSTVTVGVVYRESQVPSVLLPNPTPWGTACREFTVSPGSTVEFVHVACPPGFGEPLTDG